MSQPAPGAAQFDDRNRRAEELFAQKSLELDIATDRMFGVLMVFQWIAAIVIAFAVSPRTYAGPESSVHPHVVLALWYGGLLTLFPVALTILKPGSSVTKYVVACAQVLMSGLLIHVTNGRIETHFHVFGSLAFLAFYRDWRVIAAATLVVGADHLFRGLVAPASVYGIGADPNWRWLEHVAWVAFEDVVLVMSCARTNAGWRRSAERQVDLEQTNADIERKVVERTKAAKESEALKASVLESAQDGILLLDHTSKILEFNHAAAATTGYSQDEAVGRSFFELLVPAEHRDSAIAEFEGFVDSGASDWIGSRRETLALKKDGSSFVVEITPSAIASSNPPLITVFIRDITARKALETQLGHAQKMESIGQLASGIAHEINTPTQYIGDNTRFLRTAFQKVVELLESYEKLTLAATKPVEFEKALAEVAAAKKKANLAFLCEEIPGAIAESLVGIERVSSIVSAMKEFAHPGVDDVTAVNLNRIVESTTTVARNEWKYVAELDLQLDPSIPDVPCIPGEIGQVILNLTVNAAHAIADVHKGTSTKGKITIVTSLCGDWVEIRLSDTGAGIPVSAQSKVFDPFFTTKEVGRGTGQGLAITHSVIVARHRGELSFTTEDGVGTTFLIRLPVNVSKLDQGVAA